MFASQFSGHGFKSGLKRTLQATCRSNTTVFPVYIKFEKYGRNFTFIGGVGVLNTVTKNQNVQPVSDTIKQGSPTVLKLRHILLGNW